MNLIIFEWLSTFFFLLGAILYSGKRASNPKIRMYGFILYLLGGIIFIFVNFIYELYPFLITQILFTILNIRGVYNCLKELK